MKKIIQIYYTICLLLLIGHSAVFGQQVNYKLNQSIDTSASFIARDFIRLEQGFSFNPAGGKTLHLSIDEHILAPADYQTKFQIPNPNRSLNTSYAVGSILGEASVSPTGAALYQIAIDVMPGTGGVQPNISVVYNSQAGNGVVGYGWHLNAISAITRTGSTLYHDGTIRIPNLTPSDNLMFDGQRLMRATGSNLMPTSTYKTEIESYQTITCKSQNGYLGFEVINTDGWTFQYGSSSDSYILPAGNSTPYAWLLKSVTDANGNYMTYTYGNNAATGEFWIKQIDYTGNPAAILDPYNRIEFFYDFRTDSTTHYIAAQNIVPTKTKQSLILKRIKCSTEGSAVREYRFNYYYDDFISKLTEVEVYGQNGIRYNSTLVNWGDYGVGDVVKTGGENEVPRTPFINAPPIFADFNGDGKTGFISYHHDQYIDYRIDTAFLYVPNKSINGDIEFFKHSTIPFNGRFRGFIPADLNGDGLMDVIQAKRNSNDDGFNYTYYMYDGTSFTATHTLDSPSPPHEVFIGDFNGDGKDEILTKSHRLFDQNGGVGTTITGINWGLSYVSTGWFSGLVNERVKVSRKLIDFNGNGKANILVMDINGYTVYELNDSGTAFFSLISGTELKCFTTGLYKTPLFADFNGDGKTDILTCYKPANAPPEYFILFSTGTGFEKKALPDLNMHLDVQKEWAVADFNRDGRSDIVQQSSVNGHLKIGIFNGETFKFETHGTNLLNGENLDSNWEHLFFSDFDGDGYPELMYSKWSNRFVVKSFTGKHNLLVKNIVNGLNQKSSFTYHPITDSNYYQKSSSHVTFPVSHFQQPLHVVSSWVQQLGNLTDTLSYHYKGAKIHKQGKGFLGFEEVTTTNKLQNKKATIQYAYHPIFFNIYPTKQTVTTIAGDSISRTTFQHAYLTTSVPKVIFPYINKQNTVDKLTGISSSVDYVYHSTDHGRPALITHKQGNLTTQTFYTWEAKGASLYKNRVTQQQTIQQGIGTPFTQTQTFAYDAKARLTQQIDFFGHPKAVTTTYSSYNPFGTPLTVTTTATNAPTITTSSAYDSTGRFVTSHIDELGKISYAKYDKRTGMLLEQTDIAGIKTSYLYNGFQQLIQTESPFDKLIYATAWSISGNNLYSTSVTSLVSGVQTTFYGAAGQELRTQSQGFSGTVVTENAYNTKGQLYRSYLPGYGNSSQQFIEYAYDPYGRLLSETNIGRTTTYAYNGLTTTITSPNGKSRSSTLNSTGWLASATDEAGTAVTFTYNSLGKPLTTTVAGDVTNITYDDRGFRQSLQDVNMPNPIQYVYDAYGQLVSQTNQHGQNTTYQYDVAGQITQQTAPERTLTYQYVSNGNGIGQIQTILQNNNIVRSYAYTPLGQMASITEKIDNVDYTSSYIYNTNGLLQQRQSPSGMNVTYQYNYGMLTAMRNAENNALLWQANTINALGQITQSTLGNGLQRVTGYDTYHLPNQIELKDGSTVVDVVGYGFNPTTGNLTSRNDISNSRNELFGYDALNRLDSLRLNNGVFNRMTYHPNGNINTKYNVGTYQYANNSHAVSGISNPVPGYNHPAFTLTNTSYHRPSSLTLAGNPAKKMDFEYNADNQRNKTLYYENNVLEKTMYYVGNYEKEMIEGGSINEYDYIYSPEGLAAIAVKTGGVRTIYYTHLDHLGSLRVVTTAAKTIQTRYHYDAWGSRTLVAGASITNRGFTGHEHLPEFGLINMNARLYDPVIGRFFSLDPFVVDNTYSQDFNRYTYARNNPLIYIDPDGEWVHIVIGAVIGGVINLGVKAIQGKIHSFGDGLMAFGIGAAAGALGAATGGLVSAAAGGSGGLLAGMAGGATGTAFSSPILSAGNSAYFGDPMMTGKQYVMGITTSGVIGGLIGGLVDVVQSQRRVLSFSRGNRSLGIDGGDPVPATDEFLSKAQKAWYKDAPMNRVRAFTVENVPANTQADMDAERALGATRPLSNAVTEKLTGFSNVYFNKNWAFSSAKTLFYTMGHEFVHVSQYAALGLAGVSLDLVRERGFKDMLDFHAYSYQHSLGGTMFNSFTNADKIYWQNAFPQYVNSMWWGNFSWTMGHSFTYPF